jgi:hypothetical protein
MPDEKPVAPIKPTPKTSWTAPFVWFEWAMEWTVYWFSGLAVFKVLEYVGKLSIVFGAIVYVAETPQRRDRAISDAWQIVNVASQSDGTAGRYEALQYLAKEGASLDGVRINRGELAGIKLKNATLRRAYLNRTNFSNANLAGVQFSDADLQNSVFTGANVTGANFNGAKLLCSDFRGAKGLEPAQVKQGEDWQIAVYDDGFRKKLGLTIPLTDMPNGFGPGKKWYCPFP